MSDASDGRRDRQRFRRGPAVVLTAVALVCGGAVAFRGVSGEGDSVTTSDAAEDEVVITCGQPPSAGTGTTAAGAEGVVVEVRNSSTDLMAFSWTLQDGSGGGMNAPDGTSLQVLAAPPGTELRVRCDTTERPVEGGATTVNVVDPLHYYRAVDEAEIAGCRWDTDFSDEPATVAATAEESARQAAASYGEVGELALGSGYRDAPEGDFVAVVDDLALRIHVARTPDGYRAVAKTSCQTNG